MALKYTIMDNPVTPKLYLSPIPLGQRPFAPTGSEHFCGDCLPHLSHLLTPYPLTPHPSPPYHHFLIKRQLPPR